MKKKKSDGEMNFSEYQNQRLKAWFQTDTPDEPLQDEKYRFTGESVEELSPIGIMLETIIYTGLSFVIWFVTASCYLFFVVSQFSSRGDGWLISLLLLMTHNAFVVAGVTIRRFKIHRGRPITPHAIFFVVFAFVTNFVLLYILAG